MEPLMGIPALPALIVVGILLLFTVVSVLSLPKPAPAKFRAGPTYENQREYLRDNPEVPLSGTCSYGCRN